MAPGVVLISLEFICMDADEAISIWHELSKWFAAWIFVLVGPDEHDMDLEWAIFGCCIGVQRKLIF